MCEGFHYLVNGRLLKGRSRGVIQIHNIQIMLEGGASLLRSWASQNNSFTYKLDEDSQTHISQSMFTTSDK